MNIEQANTIPILEILSKINLEPSKQSPQDAWFYSPFRNEKTPSFHVNKKYNIWYDFGEAKGGNNIAFVREYLKSVNENHNTTDALRWIRNMTGQVPIIANVTKAEYQATDPFKLVLRNKKEIQHPALIHYLEKRGIPLSIAKQYVEEASVYNLDTQKTFHSLALRNEDAGYELRNPFFKGCIGRKTITFIRGTLPKPPGVNVFEGFMDFLSVIAEQNGTPLQDDSIILNSLSCLRKATPYIHNYGYRVGYTWMDNDEAGNKASKSLADYFKSQKMLEYMPMNVMYEPFKDVNEWHVHKLNKQNTPQ